MHCCSGHVRVSFVLIHLIYQRETQKKKRFDLVKCPKYPNRAMSSRKRSRSNNLDDDKPLLSKGVASVLGVESDNDNGNGTGSDDDSELELSLSSMQKKLSTTTSASSKSTSAASKRASTGRGGGGGKSRTTVTTTPTTANQRGGKSKKRVVERAADADRVLRKTRELRDQLRRKNEMKAAAAESGNKEFDFDSDYENNDDDSSGSDNKKASKNKKGGAGAAKKSSTTTPKAIKVSAGTIPTDIVEVSELSSEEVIDGIEAIALKIAASVLAKQGFSLDIPSRAASNQIYVQEWDRIVLGGKRMTRKFLNVSVSKENKKQFLKGADAFVS